MNAQLLRRGVIAIAAIALLSCLFALSRPSDPDAHARIVDLLRGIRESEETLGRLVLEITTRRLLTYDPILTAERNLEQSLAAVRGDPAIQDEPEAKLLDQYAATVQDRRGLIESFKTTDAVFHNSSLSLPLLTHEVSNRMRAAGLDRIADAIADWDQTLFQRLHGRASEDDLNAAATRLHDLNADRPEIRPDIEMLLTHAQLLVREEEAANGLVGQILDLSHGEILSEVYRLYTERHVAEDRRAGRVLYALYAAAFLSVLSLIVTVIKLDHTFERLGGTNRLLRQRAHEFEQLTVELEGEIDQRREAQSALQHHREGLEREIDERTAALVASEACLVDAIETLPEAFALFNAEDRLVVCNSAYRALSGGTEAEVRPGITYEEVVRLARRNKLFTIQNEDPESRLQMRFAHHRAVGVCTVRSSFRLGDGRQIEMLERRTRDGGIVTLLIDVTEARQRDEAMAERSKLAALGQLAGGVAHEINNLLQPALTFPELVRDRLPPDDLESREDLDLVLESVRKAREIVRNILLFSRKQEPTLETVNLAAETRKALKFVRDLLPPGISLQQHIDMPEIMASINKTQLTQVLTNLVLNAAHASGDHGAIVVTHGETHPSPSQAEALGIEAGRGYLTLAVSDNGSGMDAATVARIFEPFFTTKPLGEGTGLGLSVVFGILKSWNGAIEVDSVLGRGTVFTLYIPTIGQDRPAETAASIAA